MVGSLEWGLNWSGPGRRGGSRPFRSHLFDLTNLLKRSAEPEASAVSSLLLDPQVYYQAYYGLQSVLKPITVNASPYSAYSCIQAPFDSHDRIDLQAYI